ncbi:MAG: hypothetical protein EG825_15985, partial [Rhodocyclaceae bacterium]|nr:hypothetical protein [Rhodocyclaceae bacterium]
GQVVAMVGEPGIGKSRLGRELAQLWLEHGYSMFGGNCQSYGTAISYLPWADLFEGYLGTKKLATMEEKAAKIEKMLGVIDPALKDWAPIVGELVGVWIPETGLTKSLDPKLRQQRLFDLVLDILTWGASQEPLLLVIEDLHWADNASLALLNYVARNIGDKAILLALLYRPLDAKHEFQTKEYFSDIQLKELSAEESIELVRTLLAIEGMPKELEELILKKSQGNPFFVEEVIKSLIEQKVVVEKDGKWQVAVQEVKNVHIPDTVQGVIMSRIDHLAPETKDVLQVASVIGRHFGYGVLEAIYSKRTVLSDHLKELNRFDLILSEQPQQYIFKHIMTQEVAYESLAFSRRRELHNSIGDHLEQTNEKALDDVLGILAHHYYYAQNWVPAFYYSVEAGDKAKKAYANQEALAHYDRALEVFDKMVEAGILPELERQIKEAEEAEKAEKEKQAQAEKK